MKAKLTHTTKYIKYLIDLSVWKIKHGRKPRIPKKLRIFLSRLQIRKYLPASIGIVLILISIIFTLSLVNDPSRAPRLKRSSSKNFLYEAGGNNFKVFVGSKNGQPAVEFEVEGKKISFIPRNMQEINGKPKKQGNKVTFENVYPGIDFSYETIKNGIKEELVLRGPTDTNTYLFDVTFQGTAPQEIIAGISSPIFKDAEGNYLFHMEPPFAIDAAGERTDDVLVQINAPRPDSQDTEYTLRLTVDPTWLDSPERVYPITIDPTVVHDTTSEFSSGQFNRNTDTGAGSAPSIETFYQELPADEHTVGLWHMNEGSDNTCAGGEDICDASGNGVDGAFQADATFNGSGKLGDDSTTYDGTGDYVDLGSSNDITGDNMQIITLEAWVRTNSTTTADIVSIKRSASNSTLIALTVNQATGTTETTDAGTLGVLTRNSADTAHDWLSHNGGYNDNKWHHIVAVTSGTVRVIYIDGEEKARDSGVGIQSVTGNTASTTIGASHSSNRLLNGQIDEVRISNIARTPEEIKASASRRPYSVYTSPVIDFTENVVSWNSLSWTELGVSTGDGETVFDSTNLVAQWNFNETSGTTANNDAEGSSCGGTPANCDGTLSGFDDTTSQDADPDSSWTANNRRWGAGALQFDNVDSYVGVGDQAVIDSLTAFTMCAWVNHTTMDDDDAILTKYDNAGIDGFFFLRDETGQTSGRTDTYKIIVGDSTDADAAEIEGATNAAVLGKWTHVCTTFTADDATGLHLYVNSIEDPNSPVSTTGITAIDSNTTNLAIGRYDNGASAYFAGIMDSVQIYSVALPQDEILSLYNSSNIELQTRVGNDTSPDDGSWDAWAPVTSEVLIESLDSITWGIDSSAVIQDSEDTNTKIEGTASQKLEIGQPQVDANTVALWHLDETNGNNGGGDDVFDETSNNNDGEFVGSNIATAVVDGISGKARTFDSSTDYIEITNDATLNLTTNFTVSGWLRRADTTTNVGDIYSSGTQTNYWFTQISTAGKLIFTERGVVDHQANTVIGDTEWHHFAFVKSGDSGTNLRIYLDGVEDGSFSTGTVTTPSGNKRIGSWTESVQSWNGDLDEIKISNVGRTAEEIAEEYRMGRDHYINMTLSSTDLSNKKSLPFYIAGDRPGTYLEATIGESEYVNGQPDANTVGLWHLDEGTDDACDGGNSDACDSSGNRNHLDGTSTPLIIQGKVGKARNFDGTADYMECTDANCGGTSTGLDFSDANAFSYGTWIRASTPGSNDVVLGKKSDTGTVAGYHIQYLTDGRVRCRVADGTTAALTASGSVDNNEWHYVVCTADGSLLKLYVDGKFLASADLSSVTGSLDNTDAFTLGKRSGGTPEFTGGLDEVFVTRQTLSADEIRQTYERGLRTHPITIDFAADLDSGNLITGSGDTSFTIDATAYGLEQKGDAIYLGDKIIVRETVDATEYIAQGTVDAITASTGVITVTSWDSGGTFPSGGFTANASIFKWQREYFDISNLTLDSHMDAITNLTLRITNGNEGRTVWIDDLKSAGDYLTTEDGSTITSATGNRYFQYRAILTSLDEAVSATLSAVTVDYDLNAAPTAPTTPYAEGTTNPSGITDLTPEFSAIHNDPDADSADFYQVEVNTSSDFTGTVMWDSTKISMTTTADTVRSPDIPYAGTTLSLDGTTYYWRIKFWDVNGAEGTVSATQNFSMNGPPATPSLDLPTDTDTDIILLPVLKTTDTDPDSDYLKYKIELCENVGMTTNCNTYDQTVSPTGWSGQDAEGATAYASGTQATYTLQSNLTPSFTYYWRSYAKDPGGSDTWSATQGTPYSFTITDAPDQATTCVIRETDDDSQFTLEWLDIATDEDGYEVERDVNSGGWASLQTLAANSTSHVDSTISSGNTYAYRVAPYYTGPVYGEWCYMFPNNLLDISIGTFKIN